ncbi:MAG: phosphate acyltransferase [bacterium]
MARSNPVLRSLRERASTSVRRLVLPESSDPRIVLAAATLQQTGLARPLLFGRASQPLTTAGNDPACQRILGADNWIDPTAGTKRQEIADVILRRRRHRGMTPGQAYVKAAEPLYQAMALLALGEADGVVAGASVATAEVARAALWTVGTGDGARTVFGAILMLPPDTGPAGGRRPLLFADCAVVPQPTTEQLVEIACRTGRSFELLLGKPPAVALLSFSSHGSSLHPAAVQVAEVAATVALRHPDWRVVGEIQADAALVPDVARDKGIDWGAGGVADVLIFPDLGSGNIGYKLVERLGGWRAVGPLLQGVRYPICDLSRGCSALDVVDAAALVSLQCDERRQRT